MNLTTVVAFHVDFSRPQAFAQAGNGLADYNGDGYSDLAIGAPGEDIGTISSAGAVNVIYGSASGLSATAKADQFWSQSSGGINDEPEADDGFGNAIAYGDFNGDGYDDLGIGIPGEDVGTARDSGAVAVIYGSSAGLKASAASDGSGRADQLWHQNVAGIDDAAESGDAFGSALAAGDLNGDGHDDLVVGTPNESIGGVKAGSATVIYGSSKGLSASAALADQIITQLPVSSQDGGDLFAKSLATGDFDNDGYEDLAIGVPGKNSVDGVEDSGTVNVLRGSPAGISSSGARMVIVQGENGFEDSPEAGDGAGMSLASSDFNGDGFDDLAIGVPFEDIVTQGNNAGAVGVIYGSSAGLSPSAQGDGTGTPDQFWHQFDPTSVETSSNNSSTNITAKAQDEPVLIIQHPAAQLDDQYGSSLAAGDFNGDGNADLAIGVPGESVAGISGAGSVNMLYGSAAGGLQDVSPHDQNWHQNSSGIRDAVEQDDRFGNAVAAADYNGDGYDDLAIGVAAENIGAEDSGAVNVIYGSPTTLRASPSGSTPEDQFWSQNSGNVNDISETGDSLGFSLA